jgi:hypothetical protein
MVGQVNKPAGPWSDRSRTRLQAHGRSERPENGATRLLAQRLCAGGDDQGRPCCGLDRRRYRPAAPIRWAWRDSIAGRPASRITARWLSACRWPHGQVCPLPTAYICRNSGPATASLDNRPRSRTTLFSKPSWRSRWARSVRPLPTEFPRQPLLQWHRCPLKHPEPSSSNPGPR